MPQQVLDVLEPEPLREQERRRRVTKVVEVECWSGVGSVPRTGFAVEGEYRRLLLARLAAAGITPITARRVSVVDGDRKDGAVAEQGEALGGPANGD